MRRSAAERHRCVEPAHNAEVRASAALQRTDIELVASGDGHHVIVSEPVADGTSGQRGVRRPGARETQSSRYVEAEPSAHKRDLDGRGVVGVAECAVAGAESERIEGAAQGNTLRSVARSSKVLDACRAPRLDDGQHDDAPTSGARWRRRNAFASIA